MKLELFDFIDNTLELLQNYNPVLENISEKSIKFIKELFSDDENFLNISFRIKSQKSLREKIIKNDFYFKYENPEDVILNLSDLVGIRIECRFIKDEEYIFNEIKDKFNIPVGNGYFKAKEDFPLKLKLSEKQPQIQQNGFEIYKIDGIYEYGKNIFRFELQIKSMVNVFWGEIDHKILYKNYNYMLTEDFFREMMSSIKDSLSMVDRQLMILYDHISNLDINTVVSAEKQLNYFLSKIIHDVFITKIKEEFGFVFNFKNATDVIVEYLQMKAVKRKELSYGENFVALINKINEIAYLDINLEEEIKIELASNYFDEFTKDIGSIIISVLNKDFSWNLFFKIIYQIEDGNYNEIFQDFLSFIRFKYSILFLNFKENNKLSEKEIDYIEEETLKSVTEIFSENHSLSFLLDSSICVIKEIFEKGDVSKKTKENLCIDINKSLRLCSGSI
ncbi:GTP pyrophosphokinase [Anaerosphaera multitolerans]|uniref:(P)ppGpp synthetase n=1 Tax=Anaerosphaera multitolerans TaxID=2487351 RepID=A0A437S862_9FIRM|nr:(p)ppGpp synthetase [Anaerosphaera multitolerans]RVU55192.1 (p)ppGpp synthetase [Anaerosphaera multitolerans]